MNRPLPPSESPAGFSVLDFLFGSPSREFRKLGRRPRFLAPVLTLAFGTLALSLWFYARLDVDWFGRYLLVTQPLAARLGQAGGLPLSREALIWPASLSAAFGTLYGWLAFSLYLAFAARAMRRPLRLRQAMALAAWAQVPFIVMLLPSAANVALHPEGRLAPDQLDPTTFATMLGVPDDAFARGLLSRLGLAHVWSWGLLVLGVRTLMALRLSTALALVVAPVALVYGGLAAIAVLAG